MDTTHWSESMRREAIKALLLGAAGTTVVAGQASAQSQCSACYPQLPVEEGLSPLNLQYEPGNVLRYGAVLADPNPAAACSEALKNANNKAFKNAKKVAAPIDSPIKRIVFPEGTYCYSESPNWAVNGITLEAQGRVRLEFSGLGDDAWIFDAGDQKIYNCRMIGNFVINGTAAAKNGLFIRSIHQSRFEALVMNVSESGCDINFCVGTSFRVNTTVGGGPNFVAPPIRGYYIKGRGTGEYTSCCQFYDIAIDRCSGFGIDIEYASGCSFYGGSVEYCGGGIRVDELKLCQDNSFYSIDCEENFIYDVVIFGQYNRLVGCTALSDFCAPSNCNPSPNDNLIIGSGAAGTQVIGGYWRTCRLQPGSHQTLLQNTGFVNTLGGITGAGGYHASGCFFVDPTSALRTADMPDVLGGQLRMTGLPTSNVGLPSGSLWNSGGFVRIA